jgi:hypothetical protein
VDQAWRRTSANGSSKIEPDPARPRYLLTEPGAGYRLVDPTTRG